MAVRGEVYSNLSSFMMGEPKGGLQQTGMSPPKVNVCLGAGLEAEGKSSDLMLFLNIDPGLTKDNRNQCPEWTKLLKGKLSRTEWGGKAGQGRGLIDGPGKERRD